MPHNLVIDISILKSFQDTISVKDIKAPSKVTIITSGDEMIAKVQAPRDVEAELTPVVEDVSKVEGAAEDKPEAAAAEGEGKTKPDKA